MLNVTVETWMSNAAAVLRGTWGAVTRRAHQSGSSRTTLYMHAHRVVQAVASEPAGGISYDALWQKTSRSRRKTRRCGTPGLKLKPCVRPSNVPSQAQAAIAP